MKADYKYYISSYDWDNTLSEYQIFLFCASPKDESIAVEWIQIYHGPLNEGGANYSTKSFILVGEQKSLFENRRNIPAQFFYMIKNNLKRMYEEVCKFSDNCASLNIDHRSRFFGCPQSKVYINIDGEGIYVNPNSFYDYLEIEHDVCTPLSSNNIQDPLNIFWNIKKGPDIYIEYSNDLRYIEKEIGINYDLAKHIHVSDNGRYLSLADSEILLYAIYGYYTSLINQILGYYIYNLLYENGRRRLT